MHECPVTVFPQQIRWETDGTSRIPFHAYTDEALYRRELDRLFYNGHWCYVGLEAEIPNAGDFKRTVIGERSVLLVRDKDASIHVVENVCAHRGMAFCRERHGNRESLTCPYHPGLLHTWFVAFGLWRADNKSQLLMDAQHRHAAMVSTRGAAGKAADVTQVSSFKASMSLNDPRFLDIAQEDWWAGPPPAASSGDAAVPSAPASVPTAVMMTVFPSVIFQQQVNSVSTRHIQPDGKGAFDFVWTHFGFEDDSEAMTQRRLRQANLFGPAGFVSADDG